MAPMFIIPEDPSIEMARSGYETVIVGPREGVAIWALRMRCDPAWSIVIIGVSLTRFGFAFCEFDVVVFNVIVFGVGVFSFVAFSMFVC